MDEEKKEPTTDAVMPENEPVAEPVPAKEITEQPVENPSVTAEPAQNPATPAPQKKSFDLKAWLRNLSRKGKILLAAAVVLCVVLVVACISGASNTWKTPVKTIEKYSNMETYDVAKAYDAYLNGFCESERKKINKIMKVSNEWKDSIEDAETSLMYIYAEQCEYFGDDFHISFNVTDKQKLSDYDLRDCQVELQSMIDYYGTYAEAAEDYDLDDWLDFSEDLGLTRAEGKDLTEALQKFADKNDRVKVTEGYDLEVEVTLTGSNLSEPITYPLTMTVLKADGRWIDVTNLDSTFGIFPQLFTYYYSGYRLRPTSYYY